MKHIIDTYKYNVQAIIKKMTGKYNEDIEQEVYIKIWENRYNYKEQNKYKSWLNTITYNLCRDYLKSSDTKNQSKFANEETLQNIKDYQKYDEKLDSLARQKRILKEINKLPVKLKKVIIYYELEEKSYEDISILLDIPIGTVKSRIHNAKELLKIALKDLISE